MPKFKVILLLLIHTSFVIGQTDMNVKDKEILNWTEEFLIKEDYFSFLKDSSNQVIMPKHIKGRYHVYLIESQTFDSLQVSIYQIGVNSSHGHDMFLINRRHHNQKDAFQVIGNDVSLQDVLLFYELFREYKKFSPETQLICYKSIIGTYHYYKKSFPTSEE